MQEARDFLSTSRLDVVIHHSPCDDGHAAAALFYHKDKTVVLYGLHPKDKLLTPHVCDLIRGKNVVFVDIAFDSDVMTEASKLANKVIVLDHHITNQTTLEKLVLPNLRSVFVMGDAGVCLAWQFLYGDQEMPPALRYIGLKDVWKHEGDQDAVYFTTAFNRPKTWEEWIPFIEETEEIGVVKRTLEHGQVIYDYQRSVLQTMMQKVQYTEWRGYRVAIVNVPFPWISDIGALMCEVEPERTIAVVWNKPASGPYSVSLRSHNPLGPNIEQIALEFNGGGHVHGAGLRTDEPPYVVFSDNGLFY